ncbi:MAG: hypothetical protein IJ297_03105 [Clostridia bacterium]|nr:hypothetical protein [Clostridia bacterium]
MARKIVFVRGMAGCEMIPVSKKLGIDAKVDCIITQNGELICDKQDCDTTLDGDAVILELSETDTMKLTANVCGKLQIRYVTSEEVGLEAEQTFEVRENLFGEVSGKKAGFIYFGIVEAVPMSAAEIESMDVSKVTTFTIPAGRYCIACRKCITAIVGDGGYDYINDFEKSVVEGYNVYTLPHKATVPMEFTVELEGGMRNA